ncbi:MAG: ankyrin repeat domain-containing protein, partial [Pyrinomonadaceae bacterium]
QKLYTLSRLAWRIAAATLTAVMSISATAYAQIPATADAGIHRPVVELTGKRKAAGTFSHLYGNVTSSLGAPAVSALVTITNEQTKEVHPIATDEEGKFRVRLSGDYSYELRIEYPGFPTFVHSGINLRAAADTRWDVELRLNSAGELITNFQYQQPLVRAVQDEYTQQIAELLRRGVDVDQAEDDGTTALHVAVLRNREDIIRQLLKAGANPNALNERGENVLFLVNDKDDNDLIKFVLQIGADVNQVNRDGNTPLIRFANWDEDDRLKFFVDAGADLDMQNANGNTALMVAAAKGNDSAVKVLLAGGANLSVQNADGKAALDLALLSEDDWTIELLRAAAAQPVHQVQRLQLPDQVNSPVKPKD